MNMKKKQTQILAIIVAAVILVAALVFHLVRINSDPLVSLSYLNNTVQPELEKEFSNQLDVKAEDKSICDVTDGKTLGKGDTLASNHLFIALADGASIKSSSDTVFMVRGVCTVS